MTQEVKTMFTLLALYIKVLFQVPAVLLPILLPTYGPGNTVSPSVWVPATHVGKPRWSSRFVAIVWPNSGCCRDLGSKQDD